jgi:GNAT superfamily N-acetyltransferase
VRDILSDFSNRELVKTTIRANWENYHYCLGRSPSVELSIGKYLTWLITDMPDFFMNLVVCTELPTDGAEELIEDSLAHFRTKKIRRLSWLAEPGVPANELKNHLTARGFTFHESYSAEMAADLTKLPKDISALAGLRIIRVEDFDSLKKWIKVASIGFGMPPEVEPIWCELFAEAIFIPPFRTYLALLDEMPVATSQLFTSAAVAGVYNVTCLPEARNKGIGAAITMAPLKDAVEMGYCVGILQASRMGYKVYQRLGFEDFGKLSVYLWERQTDQ